MSASEPPTTFVPLTEARGPLELRKESWRKGAHDLLAGDAPVARLDYAQWSGKTRAQAADGEWAFGRTKGFSHRTIKVVDPGSERELASFARRTWKRGGSVELGGATYALTASGMFKPAWRWERDGRELLAVEQTSSLGETKARVTLTDAGRTDPNASLLVLLAIHVALTSSSESAAGASAAAGSTGAVGGS